MISEEELEERIRRGVRKELARALGAELPDEYVPLPDAWERLGCKSYKEALSYIKNGTFRAGEEYQSRPTGQTGQPRLYINVLKALRRFDELTRESA